MTTTALWTAFRLRTRALRSERIYLHKGAFLEAKRLANKNKYILVEALKGIIADA